MSEDRTAQLTEANKLLRKVLAGNGKIQANFYFAGNAAGSDAGLIVTLSARDKNGKKVASQGKALRKAISGARFAVGTVLMDGGKLTFEQQGGSAPPALLKKAFKGALITPDSGGLGALRFLAKARIRKGGAPGEEAEVEEGEALSTDELSILSDGALSTDELRTLQSEQGSLSALNAQLSKTFLSEEAIHAEVAESISDSQEQIAALEARVEALGDDADPAEVKAVFEALYEERSLLAELQATGPDPFGGDTVDEDFQRSLESSSDQLSLTIRAEIQKLSVQGCALLQKAEAGDFTDWQAEIGTPLGVLQDALNRYLRQLDGVLAEFGVIPKSKASKGAPSSLAELGDTLGMSGDDVSSFTRETADSFSAPVSSTAVPTTTDKTESVDSILDTEIELAEVLKTGSEDQIERAFAQLDEARQRIALLDAVGSDPFASGTVDDTFQRSLEATTDQSLRQLREQLLTIDASYDTLLQQIRTAPEPWSLEAVQAALAERRRLGREQVRRIDELRSEFV